VLINTIFLIFCFNQVRQIISYERSLLLVVSLFAFTSVIIYSYDFFLMESYIRHIIKKLIGYNNFNSKLKIFFNRLCCLYFWLCWRL